MSKTRELSWTRDFRLNCVQVYLVSRDFLDQTDNFLFFLQPNCWFESVPINSVAWGVSNHPVEAKFKSTRPISTSTRETSQSVPGRPGRAVHFRNLPNDRRTTRNHHISQMPNEFSRFCSCSNRVIFLLSRN